MTTPVQNAGLLLRGGEVLSSDGTVTPADVRIRDNRIAAIAPDLPANGRGTETVIDARGRLAIPGLVNAHLHSHENFNKGRFDNLPLEVWQLFARPPLGFEPLTAEEVYLRTMVGCLEMLKTGTTTAYDDVFHIPMISHELADAVARAYDDIGMRARMSCNVADRPIYETIPFLRDALPADVLADFDAHPRPDATALLGFARELLEGFPRANGRVGLALAPSAPQRCSNRLLCGMAELAADGDLPLITHVLETQAQVVTGERFYGKTIVEHLAELGVLGRETAIVHGVWLSGADIALLAELGCSVLHNPVSNLKLGAGIAPVAKMLRAGINIALGCDGTGSNDSQNMFEAMKFAGLLGKVRGDDFSQWIGANEAFAMCTKGGAQAGRLADIGELRPGALADVVLLDLRRIAFQPRNNLLNQLVFCEKGASVDMVIVDGRVVVRDGRLTTVDEDGLLAEIAAAYEAARRKRAEADRQSERLMPHFATAWRRCAAETTSKHAYIGGCCPHKA